MFRRILPLLLGMAACGKYPAPTDLGSSRPFLLASTGAQVFPGQSPFIQLGPANLASDADVFAVFGEFYGVPWDEFAAGQAAPQAWIDVYDQIAAQAAAAGKPISLEVRPASGNYLAPKTQISSRQLTTQGNWSTSCYDFDSASDGAAMRTAYVRYVDYLVKRLKPRWLNHAVEINAFQVACKAQWTGMVSTINAAYDQAKSSQPDLIVYPSFQIDELNGYANCPSPKTPDQCFEENYPTIQAVKRDRFGISTYPYLQNGIQTVDRIPADYITKAADRGGERLIIAETGWNSDSMVGQLAGLCVAVNPSTLKDQLAYFELLVSLAKSRNIELVTWWSNRDLVPTLLMTDYPCQFDKTWCSIEQVATDAGGHDLSTRFFNQLTLKIWGTMGIRRYDGTPKRHVFDRWQAVTSLPVVQ